MRGQSPRFSLAAYTIRCYATGNGSLVQLHDLGPAIAALVDRAVVVRAVLFTDYEVSLAADVLKRLVEIALRAAAHRPGHGVDIAHHGLPGLDHWSQISTSAMKGSGPAYRRCSSVRLMVQFQPSKLRTAMRAAFS